MNTSVVDINTGLPSLIPVEDLTSVEKVALEYTDLGLFDGEDKARIWAEHCARVRRANPPWVVPTLMVLVILLMTCLGFAMTEIK